MKSYFISSWRFYLTKQSLGSDCCLLATDLFSLFEWRWNGKNCRQVVIGWPFTPTPPVTLDGTQTCFFLHERMCYGRLSLRLLATTQFSEINYLWISFQLHPLSQLALEGLHTWRRYFPAPHGAQGSHSPCSVPVTQLEPQILQIWP